MTDLINREVEIILSSSNKEQIREAALKIQRANRYLESIGTPRRLPEENPDFSFENLPPLRAKQQYIEILKDRESAASLNPTNALERPELVILKEYGLPDSVFRVLHRAAQPTYDLRRINVLVELASKPFDPQAVRNFGIKSYNYLREALASFTEAYTRGELEEKIELIDED